ncbi:hypothetical protein BOH72_17415 [Mycobacterium sp. WY10]|nr:hypothetical protein BOH72_17415 [Mycobacterium sp. WY10]
MNLGLTPDEWLGEHTTADAALIHTAPGGALSEAARQASVKASLSLLGLYFAGGDQELSDRSAASMSEADADVRALQAGLRLRVALAAGDKLLKLLDAIAKRSTFRYELRPADHVGSLRAALDINRWATRASGYGQDLTYPVLEVRRGAHTPENVLATYAALWLRNELKSSFSESVATSDATEYAPIRRLLDRIQRTVQLPVFSECVIDAQSIRTRAAAKRIAGEVNRRLRRREITNPGPYRVLTEWIERCLDGHPAVDPGEIDLSVYGPRFDTKLFELWCLGALGSVLAAALNVPEPPVNERWRRGDPAYTFESFPGRLDLYFQKSVATISTGHAARWVKENGRRLGGIPDIAVRAQLTSGGVRFAVIDPKLRQRDRLPVEELYKILGYLHNFDIRPAVGILLIYTAGLEAVEPDIFHDGQGGVLISVSLNPAAPEVVCAPAFECVARTLLGLIGYEPPTPQDFGNSTIDVAWADERVEASINDTKGVLAAWGRTHLSEIGPSRDRIETLVGEARWKALDEDTRIMMATSDLVGHQLDPIADFSGPVIGMCAAVEHLLHAAVITPVVGNDKDRQRQTRTFGAAIDSIHQACQGRGGYLQTAIRNHLQQLQVDLQEIEHLVPTWRRLNRSFRVPAAHRKVLTKADWQQLYRLVMGADTLFTRTYDALYPHV